VFAKKIGIDLGTASVRVYVRGEGIVMDEPSAAAVEVGGSRVLAVGRQAEELAASLPHAVRLARPLHDGAIADLAIMEQVLRLLVARAQGRQRLFRPEVMMCVPAAASGRDRRLMTEAAISAGARQAWLIDAPLAAAMGAGLPVAEPRGHAVCDVGAGAVQAAVVALSGVVVVQAARAGGDHFDAAIADWVRDRHHVALEPRSAEALKVALGSAQVLDRPRTLEVTGLEVGGASSVTVAVSSADVTDAMRGPLEAVTAVVRRVLDQAPGRLAADVAERGVVVTGGGALLRNLDRHLERETGVAVRVAEDPRTCAVRGARRALGEFELIQRRQLYLR
jgi:rod shape-determining protein MreB and related proteins